MGRRALVGSVSHALSAAQFDPARQGTDAVQPNGAEPGSGQLCDYGSTHCDGNSDDEPKCRAEIYINRKEKVREFFLWAGKQSLEIYMMHGLLLNIFKSSVAIQFSSIEGYLLTAGNFNRAMCSGYPPARSKCRTQESIKYSIKVQRRNDMHPRVLIVGTVPYNTKSTSRAFDAYFHYWEKENIAQIFSNTKKPCKGHCETLFQITDHRVLQRWMGKKVDTGVIYHYDELDTEWKDNDLELGNAKAEVAYKFGGKHTPLTHLLRGILWRKRFWCTEKLNNWLDDFKPECVFLAFSDDYFIPQIAMYVAKRYNVPIVSCIGDDYYFNVEKTLNPIYHLYKSTYKKLIDKVLAWPGSAIYISDKIRDKYNSEFGLDGETVYLTSTVQRKPFSVINKDCPVITYFGNIGMGRNNSLNDIGYALGKINPEYMLEVYSNEKDEQVYSVFKDNQNVKYMGSVPYTQVQKRMAESDITVIVEGFEEKDINLSRYSLSTKAADALASGASILTYGSLESGIIEYMQSTDAAMVCTDKAKLVDSITQLISNQEIQKKYYEQAIVMTREHHNLQASCKTSENVVAKAIQHMK